jgi:16S rRNA (cytosine1402-N4)-methyltransferase
MSHRPVLLHEAIEALAVKPEGVYLDATVGAGGHARGIAQRLRPPQGRLIALDLDPKALEAARKSLSEYLDRVELVQANFSDLEGVLDELSISKIDGALFDLGLSSLQLADPTRGFSFQLDSPLDMRFSPNSTLTAREIVNEYPREELIRILKEYGEERFASRITSEIVRAREQAPIETTKQLVELIERAIPKPAQRAYFRGQAVHPATRTFQALRIAVNDELDNLKRGLEAAFRRLKPSGRLVVISFHSLEDRIVKHFMRKQAQGCTCPPEFPICRCERTPKAELLGRVMPSAEEISENPRARSARMRTLHRL